MIVDFKRSKVTELLGSTEEVLDYADMYGMDIAKAALLEQCGQYAEASALHLENGDLPDAVRLCLRAPLDRQCFERVAARLMDEFWNFAALVDRPFDAEHAQFRTLNSLVSKLLEGRASAERRTEVRTHPNRRCVLLIMCPALPAIGSSFGRQPPTGTTRPQPSPS